jgi:hypothetical protein
LPRFREMIVYCQSCKDISYGLRQPVKYRRL